MNKPIAPLPTMEPSDLTIDRDQLVQISGGDRAFELMLLRTYLDDSVHRLELLRRAAEEGNLSEIHFQAHQLRGASAGVGAQGVLHLARLLEAKDRQTSRDGLLALIGQLATNLSKIEAFVVALEAEVDD